jgi:hypothetical protein
MLSLIYSQMDLMTLKKAGQEQLLEFNVAVTKRATGHLSVYTIEMSILLAAEWAEEVRMTG